MKFTHEGYEVGVDARTGPEYRRKIKLRETKISWIGQDGRRYSKKHYGNTSGSWPLYKLDLASVKPLSDNPPT